jgi:hypothetical protein
MMWFIISIIVIVIFVVVIIQQKKTSTQKTSDTLRKTKPPQSRPQDDFELWVSILEKERR